MEAVASEICESLWPKFVPTELRWLSKQIRPFFLWHILSFLCIAAASLLGIVTPLVLGRLIDDVLPHRKLPLLVAMVFLLFVSYQGRTLLTSVGAYVNLAAAQRLALSLRMAVLRHLDRLSADYYDKTSKGTAGYALKEPIEEIAYFGSDLFPSMLRMLLTLGFTLGAMLWLSPALTVVTLPLIPLFLVTRQHFRNRLIVFSNLVQSDRLKFADFLQEHLASIPAIQLLAREWRQERKAFLLLGQIVHSQQKVFMTGVWFTGSTSLVIALAMCGVIGYGGWRVFAGRVTVVTLVAFYGFVSQLFDPLSSVAEMYTRTQKIFASIRQVRRIFAVSPAITDCPSAIRLTEDHPWQIEVVGLKFQYEGQRTKLHIPRLGILPGEQIAIAGENGAGKSTLAKLIVRIYDGASGSIRLGGIDIRSLELAGLRRCVCYLPREPVLFAGTLASNLRFVRHGVSPQELEKVLERVGLIALLSMLNGDLNHEIGPAGCRLSGGQRQRLAIARALLQRPRVLILDEATSCLDPVSEELVLRNVRGHLATSTLIVISHRLSTVSSFPRILVLSDGRIVADGNPDTLVSQCDTYSSLFCDRNANA